MLMSWFSANTTYPLRILQPIANRHQPSTALYKFQHMLDRNVGGNDQALAIKELQEKRAYSRGFFSG